MGALDTTVWDTVRSSSGRRLLDLAGPFGPDVEMVPKSAPVRKRHYIPLTMIDEPFTLFWQDVEVSRAMGTHLELGKAARRDGLPRPRDDLILGGLWEQADKAVGLKSDWSKAEGPLDSIVAATELFGDGFLGPYASCSARHSIRRPNVSRTAWDGMM